MMVHEPEAFKYGSHDASLSLSPNIRLMMLHPIERVRLIYRHLVQESLCRQVTAINRLCARGMRFWDYGNSLYEQARWLSTRCRSSLTTRCRE